MLIISLSLSSNSLEPSATKIIRSASLAIFFALLTPICSTLSSVFLIPAVSIILRLIPPRLIFSSKVSRVVPSISVTIALSSPSIKLRSDDFPALGFPRITVLTPSFIIFPLSKDLIIFFILKILSFNISFISSSYPSKLICSGSSNADSIKAM